MIGSLRRLNARLLFASACALVVLPLALSACGGGDSSGAQSALTAAGSDSGASSTSEAVPASARPGERATGSPIKVGVLVDEGGTAVSQPEAREAAEAVARYANEQLNGLAGHQIEVVACGTKEEAAAASACANQLVQEGVVAVVVPLTGQGPAAAPIITKAGIPYVVPTAVSSVEYSLPNVFNLTGGLPGQIGLTASYAKQHGVKNVVMYLIDAGNFIAAAQAVGTPAYEAAGIEVHFVPVPLGTPDATPQVAAGLKFKPDAVYILGDTNSCVATMKALNALGASVQRWINDPCLPPSAVQAVGAESYKGSVSFTQSDTTTDDPEARTFRWVMSEFSPKTETAGSAKQGYQAMLSFLRAASGLKGKPTAESVMAAIKTAKDVKLAIGHGETFTCNGKGNPAVPTICGEGLLAATVNGSAEVTEVERIK